LSPFVELIGTALFSARTVQSKCIKALFSLRFFAKQPTKTFQFRQRGVCISRTGEISN